MALDSVIHTSTLLFTYQGPHLILALAGDIDVIGSLLLKNNLKNYRKPQNIED